MQLLDKLGDNELAALAIKSNSVTLTTPEVVTERYVGSKRIHPGMPVGLARNSNDRLTLEHVAVIRVRPDDNIVAADKMVANIVPKSIAIGVGAGVLAAFLVIALWSWLDARAQKKLGRITPPCLVTQVSEYSVSCRQGDAELIIEEGRFFPDGRYRLDSILPGKSGFTATRIVDQRSIVFQSDSKLNHKPIGAPTK